MVQGMSIAEIADREVSVLALSSRFDGLANIVRKK